MKEWKEYQKKKEVYDKFIKNGQSLGGFTNTEKKILFGMIGGEGIIEKPFATMEREPYICVVFDDLGSSSAYSNNTSNFMNAMACRCRHKNITMIHATQHVYQIPRALRQQCSIMALFKTKDHKLLREIAKENIKVPDLTESAVYKLRKHVEQVDESAEADEDVGDDFESLYKGEISKSGTPILPSKRARKAPEKIQVSKEDLAELSQTAQPDVDVPDTNDAETENSDVSLEEVSESENQESNIQNDDSETSNS